jgi:N-acetylglucosaminyldiphosphoundecaprenol N-acetyl-beta-D-mannosaminyltransferase
MAAGVAASAPTWYLWRGKLQCSYSKHSHSGCVSCYQTHLGIAAREKALHSRSNSFDVGLCRPFAICTLNHGSDQLHTGASHSHGGGSKMSDWCQDRVNILGVNVSAITMQDALTAIEERIRNRVPFYICVTGVHGVMECQRDPHLLSIHNASGLTVPDGMPIVWMAHWLGFPGVERIYGPDLMLATSGLSAKRGYRHLYYGGAPGTADRLAAVLRARFPGLDVVGTVSPPFRAVTPEEDSEMVANINAARPDIVWVGLSTPAQERWMAEHLGRLHAPVLAGVGAAFDFLSGNKPQAPRWMQRNGLEWLFRMATEPGRLSKRYIRNNPVFVYRALAQLRSPERFPQIPLS